MLLFTEKETCGRPLGGSLLAVQVCGVFNMCKHCRVSHVCAPFCLHPTVGSLGGVLTHLSPPLTHIKNLNNNTYLALVLRSLSEFACNSHLTLPGT